MPRTAPSSAQQLLQQAYAAFNAHDWSSALSAMHPDVEWSNIVEGCVAHGHDELRAYLTHRWEGLDPQADLLRVDADDDGRIVAAVHQIVRDPDGRIVAERFVEEAYLVEDGLIRRMAVISPSRTPPTAETRTSQPLRRRH
jgi:nuclear transport factor 2 (NTF2) superfamily protein